MITGLKLRIGFYQKVRFESVGSKVESNSNPCFSYNLTVFDNFQRRKSHQNNDFRGQFYVNRQKLHQNDDLRGQFYENRQKLHPNGDFRGQFYDRFN